MKILKTLKDKFLDWLYPPKIKCIFCDNELPDENPICPVCLKEDYFNTGNRCKICDLRIKEDNIVCDNCQSYKPKFVKAVCPFIYKDNVRTSIIKFKSDGAKYLAQPFAKFMYERLLEENIVFDLIVPVPSHKDSIRARGYNQATLLAKEISLLSGKPYEEVLVKNVKTKPQKSLNFKERHENLANSMTIIDKKLVKNKVVLLVDDILTTGATLNYCSELLTNAKEIYVVTIARNERKIDKKFIRK